VNAIDLAGVSKRYAKTTDQPTLLHSLLPRRRSREELWAVRDVTMQVAEGETVGVIGRNGAGKTSLLRLMAGVTRPSEGRVSIRGRVAPLIGVGVGFHQELTGRENILVNGMLLGLDAATVRQRFDDIVDFSELHAFIDTPVKFYSSGMYMRLGFAVAANAEPEVLLVDEVLAVGDVAFQIKCFDRMRDLQGRGTTVLLVSHALASVQLLCPRCLVIDGGRVVFDGDTHEAVGLHHKLLAEQQRQAQDIAGAQVVFDEFRMLDEHGQPSLFAAAGRPLRFEATLRFLQAVDDPTFDFQIWHQGGVLAYGKQSELGRTTGHFEPGQTVRFSVDLVNHLAGGTYRALAIVATKDGRATIGESPAVVIESETVPAVLGISDLDGTLRLEDEGISDWGSLRLESGPG
jgi:ABC-2 type transport system ATP-binding protein